MKQWGLIINLSSFGELHENDVSKLVDKSFFDHLLFLVLLDLLLLLLGLVSFILMLFLLSPILFFLFFFFLFFFFVLIVAAIFSWLFNLATNFTAPGFSHAINNDRFRLNSIKWLDDAFSGCIHYIQQLWCLDRRRREFLVATSQRVSFIFPSLWQEFIYVKTTWTGDGITLKSRSIQSTTPCHWYSLHISSVSFIWK